MIYEVQGNLLLSDCDVIAHQCNCQGVMGSGIARQIRDMYPVAYTAFLEDKRTPEDKLGTFSLAYNSVGNLKFIFNLYGQIYYGRDGKQYTNYKALSESIHRMLDTLDGRQFKIGLPKYIGCGLAGGDWTKVYTIIKHVFDYKEMDCYLYEYKGEI